MRETAGCVAADRKMCSTLVEALRLSTGTVGPE